MNLPFNVDKNVRRKDYEKLPERTLRVTKIFGPTIQGEGPFAGHCAIFVRLAGCNLGAKKSCPWCDTDFALDRGVEMTIESILGMLAQSRKHAESVYPSVYPKLMILTGGEPLMQPHVSDFIRHAILEDWVVQVETNGYFWDNKLNELLKSIHIADHTWRQFRDHLYFVVSPKVNARGVYPKFNEHLLTWSSCLKILVEDDVDSPYYNIPNFAHDYAQQYQKPVYISPINIYKRQPHPNEETVSGWGPDTPLDLEACKRNAEYAAKLVVRYGYRLNLQTHLWAVMP